MIRGKSLSPGPSKNDIEVSNPLTKVLVFMTDKLKNMSHGKSLTIFLILSYISLTVLVAQLAERIPPTQEPIIIISYHLAVKNNERPGMAH